MKSCTVEGCTREHRARGLCMAHYARLYRPPRRKVQVPCTHCGTTCEKYADDIKQGRRPFCSLRCRDIYIHGQRKQVALHPDPWDVWGWCSINPQSPAVDPRPRFTAGTCARCGAHFITDRLAFENGTARHCSTRCTKAASADRRRARKAGAPSAPVNRLRVFERDGWRCQICRCKVSKTATVPHPRAATIDHIIPLAKGGSHEPVNCQTACFRCNSIKGDRLAGDQLRLIA